MTLYIVRRDTHTLYVYGNLQVHVWDHGDILTQYIFPDAATASSMAPWMEEGNRSFWLVA